MFLVLHYTVSLFLKK